MTNHEGAVVYCDSAGIVYEVGGVTHTVLRDVTCCVEPGEMVGLVGPSGSGKTSLIHLLAGLEPPSGGSVGWPLVGGTPSNRPGRVTVAFQGPSLLGALNVVENVALPLVLSGAGHTEALATARAALERLHLMELCAQLPEEISGGQAQRVALARALVTSPALLLCDEPTGQVDHSTAEELLDLVLADSRTAHTAIVIATHDSSVIARLNSRWTISEGRLSSS